MLRSIIEEIIKDCDCRNKKYCTLIELEIASHKNPRTLIQLKLIEKYKYVLNENQSNEISWDDAIQSWIKNGYAEKFSKIYYNDARPSDINDLFNAIYHNNN